MDTNKDNYYLIQALHGTRKYYSKIGSSRRNSLIVKLRFDEFKCLGNETSESDTDDMKLLNVMVDILDSQTARVSWTMEHTQRHLLTSLEIIYSPVQAR